MITDEKIQEAVDLLAGAADPVAIILFGSYAKGNAGDDSDLDLLIVERNVASVKDEIVRLRRVLSPLRIPVDIIVVSQNAFLKWQDTPGTVVYEAALEGRRLYEAAS